MSHRAGYEAHSPLKSGIALLFIVVEWAVALVGGVPASVCYFGRETGAVIAFWSMVTIPSSFGVVSCRLGRTTEKCLMNECSKDQMQEVNSLIKRVPFTSLPWIIGLVIACSLIPIGGVIALIVNHPVQPALKDIILHVSATFGLSALFLWSLLPRRKKYREKFEDMLSRSPVASWKYNDAEWEQWLRFVDRLDFGQTRNTTPRRVLFMVTLLGLVGGTFLWLIRSNTSFANAFVFCTILMSITVSVQYLYWRHVRRNFDRGPSEAHIFEDGVFFHHQFLDWKGDPDKGVLVKVNTEDQPIATLTVEMQDGSAKLAPHLREFVVPIPNDQIDDATQLARSLSQNVNLPEEEV